MADMDCIHLVMREILRYGDRVLEILRQIPEEDLWSTRNGIPNSIGVLARHLTGNLNNYFGAGISQNGFQRDRDREFRETGLPKNQVIDDLRSALDIAKTSIADIDPRRIGLPYTAPFGEEYESMEYHILRLATHFSLHCGQIEFAQTILRHRA
jgi:hypothetical protein